ncbi:response regulator [Roseomonas marmotae]|uniref:histidine kinase n=1 Tax=Roseomonas marmotae TaxID=2768161 RepID=A0ABS3KBN8_9PROT|nr:response regulator [Roseomonas marmotae]MBO1074893.1 response regulator [Roseomonas marmotae]QTI80605.1 response regulator [Roseomonas marmotae]
MHASSPSASLSGSPAERRRPGLSLAQRLLIFAAALLLPTLLLSGILLWRFAESEQLRLENEVRGSAAYLAETLDRKLEGQFLALRALSLSPYLRSGDLRGFHAQAAELGRAEGFYVLLRDASGNPVIDTSRPWGILQPTHAQLTETDRRALAAGRPAVSDLRVSQDGKASTFNIVMPVRLPDADPPFLLSLVLPAETAQWVLKAEPLPEGWTSSYVGGDGRIIARSDRSVQFRGSLATEDLRRNAVGESGVWTGTTAMGEPVVAAYRRSQLSGWRAAVGVPVAVMREPLRNSLLALGLLSASALLVSALLAFWVGRSISGGIHQLANAARRIGQAGEVSPPASGIREVDSVSEAIGAAAHDLRERALGRDRAEEALREESRSLETLNRIGSLLAAELDLDRLIQAVTDAATELSGARMGAFFYSGPDPQAGSSTHYALSGSEQDLFSRFPLSRFTALFAPTFRGDGILRIADLTQHPRYRWGRGDGGPEGQPPLRSYLAVPVVSRSGEVIGGLFFGHPEPGVFTARSERLVAGVAAQAAIAVDNARLFREASRATEALERRVAERTQELEDANARLRAEVVAREEAQSRLSQAQKMEALGQLAGGIAHDFNNVLQAITSGLALISQRAEDAARVRKLAGMATEAAERGASITRRLLTFARRGELRVEPVDAAALLDDLAAVFKHTLGPGIEVRIEASPELPPLLVDRGQLEAVLVNLATNARDAMAGGGRLQLSASAEEVTEDAPGPVELAPGTYLRLSVRDTGGGMDAAVLARATEPFFTTKPLGKGTGLGLAMAKGFAEQSGGGFGIESWPGEGTCVTLWLPRGRMEEMRASRPLPHSQALQVRPGEGGGMPAVLVVDDEPAVRAAIAADLAARGWHVTEAADALAALERIGAAPLDLLVTDLAMPGMNGLALLAEARRRRPGLPAMLVTGYMDEDSSGALQEAEQGGPFMLLRKPIPADELATHAAALLREKVRA